MSARPTAGAASRNTRSRSYQWTDHPRASAEAARASGYITELATVCARWSAIRSSVVGGRVRTQADRNPLDQHGYRCGQRRETLSRAVRCGLAHALYDRHRLGRGKRPRSRGV